MILADILWNHHFNIDEQVHWLLSRPSHRWFHRPFYRSTTGLPRSWNFWNFEIFWNSWKSHGISPKTDEGHGKVIEFWNYDEKSWNLTSECCMSTNRHRYAAKNSDQLFLCSFCTVIEFCHMVASKISPRIGEDQCNNGFIFIPHLIWWCFEIEKSWFWCILIPFLWLFYHWLKSRTLVVKAPLLSLSWVVFSLPERTT